MIDGLQNSTTIFYGTGENDLSDKCKRGAYRLMNFVKAKNGKLYAYKVEKMTYDALDDDEVKRRYEKQGAKL